jgi:hypothetical protein
MTAVDRPATIGLLGLSGLSRGSAAWLLVIKLPSLLLFWPSSLLFLITVFCDILIAQRNASSAVALRRRL